MKTFRFGNAPRPSLCQRQLKLPGSQVILLIGVLMSHLPIKKKKGNTYLKTSKQISHSASSRSFFISLSSSPLIEFMDDPEELWNDPEKPGSESFWLFLSRFCETFSCSSSKTSSKTKFIFTWLKELLNWYPDLKFCLKGKLKLTRFLISWLIYILIN